MGDYWWCAFLFRICLPCVIVIAACARPTITSYVYLLMGLWMPFFSVPTSKTMSGSTGAFMKILVTTCILVYSAVLSFYFALFAPTGPEYDMPPCGTLERILRTVGFIEVRGLPVREAVIWCLPEPLMLVTSVFAHMSFKTLTREPEESADPEEMEPTVADDIEKKLLLMFLNFGKYTVIFLFCATAVIRPSIIGAVYYLVFLSVLTYWSCNRNLDRAYAKMLVCLLPIISLHMTMLFIYQIQYFQDNETISPKSIYGRLFQLVRLRTYKDCSDPRLFVLEPSNSALALPYFLFVLYHLCVLVSREILQAEDGVLEIIAALFSRKQEEDESGKSQLDFLGSRLEFEIDLDNIYMADKIWQITEDTVQFIIGISYLIANFTMMIWSIVYVSWKNIILLMWANLIWFLPERRKIMLTTSPVLVLCIWFLLVTSYLYSLDVYIPHQFGIVDIDSGEAEDKLNWARLAIKSLFSVIIFLTMRQFFQERALKRNQASDVADKEDTVSRVTIQIKTRTWIKLENTAKKWFSLCWIWVVVITMIWMDFFSTSNPFRISFVGLAIMVVMTFQLCPFNCWKKFLRIFWWIVMIYAMINLFLVYFHQLEYLRKFLHTYVYSEEGFKDLGFFVANDRSERSVLLMNPLIFQIAIVIQRHYLQEHFDRFTSPETPVEIGRASVELEEIDPIARKIITITTDIKDAFFILMEIHLPKILLLVGWLLCCFDWCALFVPFVVLLIASCIIGRRLALFTIYLMSCFVQLLIVTRLVYMNKYTKHASWNYVGYYEKNGKSYNVTLNAADWLGFHESRYDHHFADFWSLAWSFLFVFMVTLYRVVRVRQRNYKISRDLPTTRHRVLYPDIDYQNCHDDTKSMAKFLANYGFFKLGVELSAIMSTIVIMIRMDLTAIGIALGLLSTFWLDRKWVERIWMPYMMLLALWVLFQYMTSLGYWPQYWDYSGTRFWNKSDLRVRIQQFCHLMNMAHPPLRKKIVYDFLLLMCMSRQWTVFRVTRKFRETEFGAGSNENVSHLIDAKDVDNPVPDFVTYTRNLLDVYKKIFFFSWFYLALVATFLAGTMRPAIYSFGYILAAFFIMWEGTDMFLRPAERTLFRWNLLILYNVSVMTFHAISQVYGCILIHEWGNINCKIYSILTVGCIDTFGMTRNIPDMTSKPVCTDHNNAMGLEWDCVCFFFLIIQQRTFKSFHFLHIVNNAKARQILASRGAQLIEDQRQKKRQALDSEADFIKMNIEKRLERSRAKREKVQGKNYRKKYKNHKHRLRSADYYLFDDKENDDIPLLPPKQEYIDTEYDPYDPMNFQEYLWLFIKTDIPNVLYEREVRQRQKQAAKVGREEEDLRKSVVSTDSEYDPSEAPDPIDKSAYLGTTTVRQFVNTCIFSWGMVESVIVSLTALFNRMTKDFRYIVDEMDKDKKILKEKTNYTQGVRTRVNKVWKPVKSYNEFFNAGEEEEVKKTKIYYSIFEKLLKSLWYLVLSQSEWFCYLVIVLYQVLNAKFISLPLPLMVFCWGSLTTPRPTRTFWVITIACALIISVLKNFFVMEIVDWNQNVFPENPFYPPTIMGIDMLFNQFNNLMLLFVLIFHRVVLQWQGLWEPSIYRKVTLLPSAIYKFENGKFVPPNKNETTDSEITLRIRTTRLLKGNFFLRGIRKYAEGFRLFTQQLITPTSTQIPVDVYTPMLLCDVISFLLIVFAHGYFKDIETEDMGFIDYLRNNRVPMGYICVIVAYFGIIVMDRWIYNRRNRFAKLVLHLFQVLAIHIWAFVLYPMLTGRVFTETLPVQLFYVVKCCYFLFSASQIRNGYPRLIYRDFLRHGTNVHNRVGFLAYQQIPYLGEMTSILDWTSTDTSLGVKDWFKHDQITGRIFDRKCAQDYEALMEDTDVIPQKNTTKYLIGGFLFTLLFLTIIFPFLVFSVGHTVGVKTYPTEMNLELYMGTDDPIFHSYASQKSLTRLTNEEYQNLTRTFYNIQRSEDLFSSFEPEDVVVVKWSAHSLSSWMISPGSLNELIEEVESSKPFAFQILIRYIHVGSGGLKTEGVFRESTFIPPLPSKVRQDLLDMLGAGTDRVLWLPLVFPKFLIITSQGKPKLLSIMEAPSNGMFQGKFDERTEADDTMAGDNGKRNPEQLRNLLIALRKENGQIWWQIREDCSSDDENYKNYLKDLVHNSCKHLVMYTFNEKVFPGTMYYVTGGIVGLYLLYFMLVYGIVKSCIVDVNDFWIADIPNADRIYRTCQEVYVARDMKNFELEEELFSELVFIMRSRETCIKLTRYKDDPYNPTFTTPGENS